MKIKKFNEHKSTNVLRCKKEYIDYVGEENLTENGIDHTKYYNDEYPLFKMVMNMNVPTQ